MMVVGPCKRYFRTSLPCPEGILTLKFKTRPDFEGYLQPRAMQTRPSKKLPRRNSQKKKRGKQVPSSTRSMLNTLELQRHHILDNHHGSLCNMCRSISGA